MQRREFIKCSIAGAGVFLVPSWPLGAFAQSSPENGEPHFFLQVVFPNGWDPSYLFDARPLEMTRQGIIQNYSGEEPKLWTGANGGTCLATKAVAPLEAYRQRFSILNGVLMANGFAGHDQNMNFLFTGSPFGGESFVPHLNRATHERATPLDALQSGFFFASLTNTGATVPLTPGSAVTLLQKLKNMPPLSADNPLFSFVRSRFAARSQGSGRFSKGVKKMLSGYDEAPQLAALLESMKIEAPSQSTSNAESIASFMGLAREMFQHRVTKSVVLSISLQDAFLDTHLDALAKEQPKMYPKVVDALMAVFKSLDTPFDEHRSFWDVTTVLVASEFSRTMRQTGLPIDATGTDHNPLSNMMFLGGKGIRGGHVVGASDRATASAPISKAHLTFDRDSLSVMAQPFDFGTGKPINALPEEFKASDYLTASSVANTIYSLFGVKKELYRVTDRGGPAAPLLKTLLI